MILKLLIFETHPIQYRAPVFQAMQKIAPGIFEVVYASDFSVRGYKDEGFGTNFAWDIPLLSGYPNRILNNETARRAEHWSGLTSNGVGELIRSLQPEVVMLSSLSYVFNWAVYLAARRFNIPVWIRLEAQDEAFERGPLKGMLRGLAYRLLYAGVDRAFYIGQLSRQHLMRFGIPASRLTAAHYCTPNHLITTARAERERRRKVLRQSMGIATDCTVVAFFGKLIPKKDPLLVLHAVADLQSASPMPMAILIVGSGELEPDMRRSAAALEDRAGVRTYFAGFINQSALTDYYLAADIVVLPSQRMGETWGLVINEALHAGCAAIMSDGVGCHRDFGDWPRVRVVPIRDFRAAALAIKELAALPRDFGWAEDRMRDYSTEAAAKAIVNAIYQRSGWDK